MKQAEFRHLFDVTDADLEQVRVYGKRVAPYIDAFIERLYAFMRGALGEHFAVHFPDTATLERAQGSLRRAWLEFWQGRWDPEYVASREHVGDVHAQLQIEPRHYLATMAHALKLWTEDLAPEGLSEAERRAAILAIQRVIAMEGALVVDTYNRRTQEIISQQSRALIDMSTPIAALSDGVLMLPIVGIVDSRRAQDIMRRMLEQVSERQAVAFILDISGVAVVDTAVANHLIRMTKAARLMGCEAIVSGVSAQVAETIVELGIDVGEMKTTGNLKDALKVAFRLAGIEQKS
ncbi:MAG TPA: protoglobin domain-containing protein [Polyangiaceae bacterium]